MVASIPTQTARQEATNLCQQSVFGSIAARCRVDVHVCTCVYLTTIFVVISFMAFTIAY